MSSRPLSVSTKRDAPPTSQGLRPFTLLSVSNSLKGFQVINLKSIKTANPNTEQKISARIVQDALIPHHVVKRPPAKHVRNYSLNLAQKEPSYPQTKKKSPDRPIIDFRKPISSQFQPVEKIRASGSLPNLLMEPVVNNEKPSNAKAITDKNKRIATQIAINFKVKGLTPAQSLASARTTIESREKSHSRNNSSSRALTSRIDDFRSPSYHKTSASKVALITNEIRSISPGQTSIRNLKTMPHTVNVPAISTLQGLEDLATEHFHETGREEKQVSRKHGNYSTSVQVLKTDGKINGNTRIVSTLKELGASIKRTQKAPSSNKEIKPKSEVFESKVSERQRERLAMFLKDDFVNDLIFTKFYQVMDEDQKMTALNNLKKQMSDHKVIRNKYKEYISEPESKFFEQFNMTRKEAIANFENLSQLDNKDVEHLQQIHRMHPYELFSPKESFNPESHRPRLFFSAAAGTGNNSPVSDKKKDFDFYVNLEMKKVFPESIEDKMKPKEKSPSLSPFRIRGDESQQARFARIRKAMKEKLFRCVELKITKSEVRYF